MSTILSDKIVKIRKPHSCLMCNRSFPKGTLMSCQVNTYDDHLSTVYTCATCEELKGHIETDEDNMFTQGCVKEEMNNDDFKGTPEEYLALRIAERRKNQKING